DVASALNDPVVFVMERHRAVFGSEYGRRAVSGSGAAVFRRTLTISAVSFCRVGPYRNRTAFGAATATDAVAGTDRSARVRRAVATDDATLCAVPLHIGDRLR